MSVFITGATGTLGSAIVESLTEKQEVYALIRKRKKRNRKFDINKNFFIIDGDVNNRLCGLSKQEIAHLKKKKISKFIHSAAMLKFDKSLSPNIWHTNYQGTKEALNLAKAINAKEFHFISTAYANLRRNPYESSKYAAGQMVKKMDINWSIYYPSIIIGDSQSGAIRNFNGYYGFVIGFYRLTKKSKDTTNYFPIYINCSFDSTINLITIDWLAKIFLELLEEPACGYEYYLTHHSPPLAKWTMEQTYKLLGINGIRYNDYRREQPKQGNRKMELMQRAINRQLNRFLPYVTYEPRFELKKTREVLGKRYCEAPEITIKMLKRILSFAIEKNFGLEQKGGKKCR